ncbi:unnamed protein product [Spirodela intermedia]|uniref:Uncharacterized protein n=1 Tax=Spirodela intermedia TaxID=51605 RepID=A0A7I8JEX1_SPIIN|nr:unnamed protein product [Spirodela intermedia]CAA6668704.1 unnamed protein product [Spirodela intermedia]
MITEGNRREIKAQSTAFSCPRLSWRRNYLEHIKIVIDQASLSLRLVHNEICARSKFETSLRLYNLIKHLKLFYLHKLLPQIFINSLPKDNPNNLIIYITHNFKW